RRCPSRRRTAVCRKAARCRRAALPHSADAAAEAAAEARRRTRSRPTRRDAVPATAAPARRSNRRPRPSAASAAVAAADAGGAALQWQPNIGGCESGFTIPDPTNADVIYASCYGNKVTRWDAKMGTARSIEPWEISLDSPPNEAKYRCHWTAPMAIDPFDTKNVLYGCQVILKTSNGGQSWTEFSPDLSAKDPS